MTIHSSLITLWQIRFILDMRGKKLRYKTIHVIHNFIKYKDGGKTD